MKALIPLLSVLALAFSLSSCGEVHFLKDKSYRKQVTEDLEKKKQLLPEGNLFSVLDHPELTLTEREALAFLYAYMPIGDITDYPGEFYLETVRLSFQIREEMPWQMPDEVFRHFVLPVRVNNENMDNARQVFYAELKERVKHLSMEDAILEVNHWCHEKVVYRPSDSRTSSPLATVKSAFGRCGEESTFTVAALRAVGIPARQVYTPRWAHTDDNHAWVEAWANGKWSFIGACEPEPVLNLGWFNAPASRGMLMHTKVFGRYKGSEEIMYETLNYTEINIIENYAPAANAQVRVTDEKGMPVDSAKVEFKLYNYAEFYTVATKYTDADGIASLTAGKGDMLAWVSKGSRFGYAKLTFGKNKSLDIPLNKKEGDEISLSMDMVPPSEKYSLPTISPEQQSVNDRRLAMEDSVRNVYTATFMDEKAAATLGEEMARILVHSRGNHRTLTDFLSSISDKEKMNYAFQLLKALSEKDLRDVSPDVLSDQLSYIIPKESEYEFSKANLNPRVSNEMLTPYRRCFQESIPVTDAEMYRKNPFLLVEWCKKNITVRDELNSQRIPISPMGVWRARVADKHSRDIFFVSLARSIGIPAWMDEVTGKVKFYAYCLPDDEGLASSAKENPEKEVNFEVNNYQSASSGKLFMRYQPVPYLDDPKYYAHFTLSKFENGTFRLLNYEEELSPGNPTSWATLLKKGCSLDAGYYLLTTGVRLANGNVLCQIHTFAVKKGEETMMDLVMSNSKDEIKIIGNFNSESTFRLAKSGETQSILKTTGRGYFVVGVLGVGQEPTNHALHDLTAVAKELETWGQKLVMLFPTEEQYQKFHISEFPGLPSSIVYGVDIDGAIQKQISEGMKLPNSSSLPIFIIGDTFNRVVFVSQGYTIGLGEQLMKAIHRL